MLLTLHIIKIESGDYRVHAMEGAQHLGDYEATSIREAILLAAENPLPDLAGFHLWYEHVCAGSVTAGEVHEDADDLAQRLAALHKKILWGPVKTSGRRVRHRSFGTPSRFQFAEHVRNTFLKP